MEENKYLLSFLRAFIWEQKPDCGEISWTNVIQQAKIHNVLGIVGYLAMKYGLCSDEKLQPLLRAACLNTMELFSRRIARAEVLLGQLEEVGIDYIPMKGYLLRDCYPVPELRSFNDIDFVIRPQDRTRCHELLLSLGYQCKTDWEPVYCYHAREEMYDVHTALMEIDPVGNVNTRGFFETPWEHALPVSAHGYRLEHAYHFLYLLSHIAKHLHGSGAGIRLYMDLAVYIHRYRGEIDWTAVVQSLKKLGLFRFAEVVFAAIEEWFGIETPVPASCTPEILADFLDYTMNAGTFGHYHRNPALAGLKHQKSKSPSRLRHLMRRAFPKAENLESRYTYLKGRPWLIGVAWVHRLARTSDRVGEHVREASDVFSTDDAEWKRTQDLMHQIGLG